MIIYIDAMEWRDQAIVLSTRRHGETSVNAELDTQARQQITEYLTVYAADASGYRRSRAIMSSLRYNRPPPLRITETPYFRHEHREIPRRIINLPDVGSLSQCNACHRRAEKGSFRESEIWIKGIGRWDD